jgi:stage III sporulation protein AF
MQAVSAWLLCICGVVILSVLAQLILPEGQMNKYCSMIFSFMILLVIIIPLPKIFGKDFDFSTIFGGTETSLQEDYLQQLNLDKLTSISEGINTQIEQRGLLGVVVSINANIFADELEIYNILVDLRDLEYAENFESKNITSAKATILDVIGGIVQLKNVEVKFNE